MLTLAPWHWLILAFLLLTAEALGTGGFLLGSALAAAVMAFLLWLLPEVSWSTQLILFGIGSMAFTLAYWKFFRKVNEKSDYPDLNNRTRQLIGRTVALEQDLPAGQSKLQIGDTLWLVESDCRVEQGRSVTVIDYRGMVLLVKENASQDQIAKPLA